MLFRSLLHQLDILVEERRAAEIILYKDIRREKRKLGNLERRMKYVRRQEKQTEKMRQLEKEVGDAHEQVLEVETQLQHTQGVVSEAQEQMDSLRDMMEGL